jgi:CPA2 family monovalent cation:H+ antiporter-2
MHESEHLFEIVILLCAAVMIVAVFRALRLSPVLGYLVAGTAIGPVGLGLIKDVDKSSAFAEFGVIFLMFIIHSLALHRNLILEVVCFRLQLRRACI